MVQVESSSSRSSSLGSAGKDSSDPLTDRQVDQKQADTSLHLCPLPLNPPPSPSLCMLHGGTAQKQNQCFVPVGYVIRISPFRKCK